ncbi:MAG: hypothetical protein ACKOBY_06590, partial [Cyanobium sp.]
FAAAASNRRVADATLEMLLADWPSLLRPSLAGLLRGVLPRAGNQQPRMYCSAGLGAKGPEADAAGPQPPAEWLAAAAAAPPQPFVR